MLLSELPITNLSEFDWTNYFENNQKNLIELDFSAQDYITSEEKKLITKSIKAFQIGEGSSGLHLIKSAGIYATKTGDAEYQKSILWFIREENRHSNTLKKFMLHNEMSLGKSSGLDVCFRGLRRLFGLECQVIVLVTAEMIALSYYTALPNATNSKLLKDICKQMLNDELMHVVYQSYTLHKLARDRGDMHAKIVRKIRKILMNLTLTLVYLCYRKLFLAGDFTYKSLHSACKDYLRQSVEIERQGEI